MHDHLTAPAQGTQGAVLQDPARSVTTADGSTLRVAVRGTGTADVLVLGPMAPHGSAAPRPTGYGATWDEQFRTIEVDPRWSTSGRTDLVPYDHDLVASDRLGALDSIGVDEVSVVGIGTGACEALALASRAPGRIRALALLDPVVLGEDRDWSQVAAGFDASMRLVRAEGFDGLVRAVEQDPVSAGSGPFGAQLSVDPDLHHLLRALGRERYVARIVAFRDGLFPASRRFLSVDDEAAAALTHPALVVPHPHQPASAAALATVLPAASLGSAYAPDDAAAWTAVAVFLGSVA